MRRLTEKEIIVKNYFNIGIAVARDEGLIVPVIKDADKKSHRRDRGGDQFARREGPHQSAETG